MPIPSSFDAHHHRRGLTIEGSGAITTNASKVNWNNLHSTFRPRSSQQQPPHYRRQPPLTSDDLCWGGSASAKVNGVAGGGVGVYAPPNSLAARPQSAGFPVRFLRSAKRRDESSAEAAAAAAAAAEASESEAMIAELWRIDDPDEDILELDELFDQMAKRDPSKRRKQQPLGKQKQQQSYSRPRSRASVVPPRHQKSASQLYQEHLLAEVAKHRQKNTGPRQLPPELSLFIPKTRTRLCRLYTGNCLLRSTSAPPPTATTDSGNDFVPITRSIMPLPSEMRPLSRQGWSLASGGGKGGIVQVSSDTCNCRLLRRSGSAVGGGGSLRSSAYSDNCTVCRRLRMLQLV